MRLVRFGEKGKERPGLLREENIVDLSRIFPEIPDVGPRFFAEGWLERLRAVDDPGKEMAVRLSHPVVRPSKIVCLGINYADHGAEAAQKPPSEPLLFAKAPSALNGPFDPIVLPEGSGNVDWEVELAVVVGREARRVSREAALDFVAGYTVFNDVSGREAQFAVSQWFRGKSFDTFAPMGPALVTPDEAGDVHALRITSRVNGRVMQDGTTADLIFDVPAIIEDISRNITLLPGDVIATGTPSGVGIFRNPPVVLKEGDEVACTIEGLGTIVNRVVGG
jgi:2-keto-4-pentenoate hydratase/2-oxohepta-3-ene-1,7-dioic acid hydratase in catechol pathway